MGRRNRRNRQKLVTDISVIRMAAEGKAIAHKKDGKILFVDGAMPDDVVDVLITKNRKDYAVGKVVEIKQASDKRIEPFCKHFGSCGGCKWQFISYEQQLEYKQQMVEEALRRVGKLTFPPLMPILGAEPNVYYRNKMEFTFSNKRWLTLEEIKSEEHIERNAVGFHVPNKFDRIVDIEHCYLQDEPSNSIRNEVRKYALEHELSFYDIYEHHGLLRNLIIRTSTLGETMLIFCFGEDQPENVKALLAHTLEKFPDITSLNYVVNTKKNDTIFDLEIINVHGRPFIYEKLEDFKYKISPKSFFQTNPFQAERLYQVVRDFSELKGHETVYDLYAGTGSIGIFVAKNCKKVVGIEEVEAATIDAKFNAELNNLDNTTYLCGDVKNILQPDFLAQYGQADVLIVDPPRAGLHGDVVQQILTFKPQKIVYVSCNPVTQARDLQLLCETHYSIKKVQPVDMFPHTYHVENVVQLLLNS